MAEQQDTADENHTGAAEASSEAEAPPLGESSPSEEMVSEDGLTGETAVTSGGGVEAALERLQAGGPVVMLHTDRLRNSGDLGRRRHHPCLAHRRTGLGEEATTSATKSL